EQDLGARVLHHLVGVGRLVREQAPLPVVGRLQAEPHSRLIDVRGRLHLEQTDLRAFRHGQHVSPPSLVRAFPAARVALSRPGPGGGEWVSTSETPAGPAPRIWHRACSCEGRRTLMEKAWKIARPWSIAVVVLTLGASPLLARETTIEATAPLAEHSDA